MEVGVRPGTGTRTGTGTSTSTSRGTVVVRSAAGVVARPAPLRFALTGELGRGGMGVVLRGLDPDLQREVAVKLLSHADDPVRHARFLAEAQITGQLEHPNIVPVHEFGIDPTGSPWFAMRVVEGRTLGDLLQRRAQDPALAREWPLGRLVAVLIQVCNAVAFAHSRGVIHRDLKPTNVMLGSFGAVLVMDWGLGKVLGGADSGVSATASSHDLPQSPLLTLDGTVVGTPCYMAPEQARGENDRLSVRTDVYALGAILCEVVGGRPPVTGDSVEEVVGRAAGGLAEAPRRDWRGQRAPRELLAIMRRAIAFDPLARYPSAEAVAEDLQRWLDRRSVAASDTQLHRASKFLLRHRVVTAVALLGVAVAAGILVFAAQDRQEQVAHTRQAMDHARVAQASAEEQRGLAEAERQRAAEAQERAERQRRQAEQGRRREQMLATSAERQGRRISRSLAVGGLGQADAAIARGRPAEAARLLDLVPEEERDWCWRVLRGGLHGERGPLTVVPAVRDGVALRATGDGVVVAGRGGRLAWIGAAGGAGRVIDAGRPLAASGGSADGRLLAVALNGGGVRLYDNRDGKVVTELVGSGKVDALAVSVVGTGVPLILATGSAGVRLLRPGAAHLAAPIPCAPVGEPLLAADGTWWAAPLGEGVVVRPADAASDAQQEVLAGSVGVELLALSADGRRLVGASPTLLRVWAVPGGQPVASLPLAGLPLALAPDHDASLIAVAEADGITVWDLDAGMPALRLPLAVPPVGLEWTGDGTALVALLNDGSLRIWR